MEWNLGAQGLALLGAISLAYGAAAWLLVGDGSSRRWWATAITTVACFGVGLLTSEWLFGWATEKDLQPNVDGLSRDEVLLSSLLTTIVVVVVMRYLVPRLRERRTGEQHAGGRHRGHTAGHA